MSTSIIILAAGQGKRMSSAKPKVLQPLAGRPMLQHVIDISRGLGAGDICVVYGHGGDDVRAAFAHEDVRWALQAEQNGTGHAAQQAMPETPDENHLLILYGDGPLIKTTTLQDLLASSGNDEVAILTVELDDPFGYGRIIRENGVVIKSVEEKDASEKERTISEINTGVISCSARQMKGWLGNLNNDNSQGEYYLTDVVGMAVADGIVVNGVKTNDQVETMGINDRRQLAVAERALQRRLVDELLDQGVTFADPDRVDIRGNLTCGKDVFIDVNAIFEGDVSLADNVKVESNNVIRDCTIGSGSVIHPNCHFERAKMGSDCEIGPFARLRPGAELGDEVHIGNYVEIKKSTVADGSKINHLSYIGDSTVGKKVNIGAGTISCNYDGAHKHQTVIGDGAFIGSGVELIAPVEIGAGATIGAGSTISRPAPADQLTLERAKQITVKGWKSPAKRK